MNTNRYIAELNQDFFDGKLPPAFVEGLAELPVDRDDVRAYMERTFRLMQEGGFHADDLSKLQGEVLGSLIARILPGAWNGKIPPITLAGRHRLIDRLIRVNPWRDTTRPGRLLDLGCGFPPDTTVELAESMAHWTVVGGDPSLPAYLLHDDDGNYSTFDRDKQVIYFQPDLPSVESWNALLEDSEATRARFERLLQDALAVDPSPDPEQLAIDPIKKYERDNLSFVHGGIGQLDIEPVDVMRCFNVLFYFDNGFRRDAMGWFRMLLLEGGILITGGNWALSIESRYYVFQKVRERLVGREFAFSIDNLSPLAIVTWYTNHDDDEEIALLTELVRVIRSDDAFMSRFYEVSDRLRARFNVCPRGTDGFYGGVDPTMPAGELWETIAKIGEELVAELGSAAVEVLNRSGRRARLNEVGHIAVEIPDLVY